MKVGLSPWKRGPQEVWYEQMKALCCRKRDEALSKLRFRWNRGTNTETPRHSRFRGNVGISIRFAVEILAAIVNVTTRLFTASY